MNSRAKADEMTVLVARRGFQIGKAIYALRDERALTQGDVATLAGVHEITVSELEREKRMASARTARKIAAAFEMDTPAFLKLADQMNKEAEEVPEIGTSSAENIEKLEQRKRELDELDGVDRKERESDGGDPL